MGMFHRHSRGGKRLQRKPKSEHHPGVRLAALLLCLSMLTGFLPALARAEDQGGNLSSIVTFDSITLHYAGADGQSVGAAVQNNSNLYAMKFENNTQLKFGYAENEPVSAKAQINKGGSLTDKTITWTINYTPWQNPTEGDGVTLDTPFELRDTIDTSLHSYVNNSITIDGQTVTGSFSAACKKFFKNRAGKLPLNAAIYGYSS